MAGRRDVFDVDAYMASRGLSDQDVITGMDIKPSMLEAWKKSGSTPWGVRDALWQIAQAKEAAKQQRRSLES